MPPAARITDMHTCPLINPGPVPHVGGPIIKGCPTVMICFMPAARLADTAVCAGPPDAIAKGSPTVQIGYMPAARIGDMTVHGGVIVSGAPTVIIGEAGGGGAGGGGGGGGAGAGPALTPPSMIDKLQVWLWNLFHDKDHQREAYSDGVVIEGSDAFRAQTRAALDRLNNCPSGHQLLDQIDRSGHEVTIRETTTDNGFCTADNITDAQTPGTGTDSVVEWNPNHQTTDPADPVSGTPGSTVILGHELVHANHNAQGANGNGPYDSYAGQSGSSARGEERATVGAGGTSVTAPDGTTQTVPDHSGDSPTENSIRDDMGIPRRPTYYPSSWPGGPPW